MGTAMIELSGAAEDFTLLTRGGAVIRVMEGASFSVAPGERVALTGASGAGKSTLMRMIYGNYLIAAGRILVGGVDVARASPREILRLRRDTPGYLRQVPRVVLRVPTRAVAADPLLALGTPRARALQRAEELLARLGMPEPLWRLSPTTFSGGEQQRVNIARGFAHARPALLLDEPTAALDPANRSIVLDLIDVARARGAAIVGVFHDAEARARVATREVDVSVFKPERAA